MTRRTRRTRWYAQGRGRHRLHPALAACYRNSLRLAAANDCRSIAFPCISTGVYRFPFARACRIALATVKAECARLPAIERVVFVCFGQSDFEAFERIMADSNA